MHDSDLNDFLNKTPQEIKERLRKIVSSKDETYFSLNWLGIASALTTDVNQAINNKSLEMSVIWTEIVFQSYRIHSEINVDALQRNEYSEMLIRARLINTFGNKSNDPFRDAEIIYQWFF